MECTLRACLSRNLYANSQIAWIGTLHQVLAGHKQKSYPKRIFRFLGYGLLGLGGRVVAVGLWV